MQVFTYVILSLVFIASFLMVAYLPITEFWQGVATIPGIGALFFALFQIARDQSAHQRAQELQQNGQSFALGATSHMAQVAFDKHVEFCEKYMECVHEMLNELFRDGPSEGAKKYVDLFRELRTQYSIWVTEEITNGLMGFEKTLSTIAARSRTIENTKNEETRAKAGLEVDKAWEALLGNFFGDRKNSASQVDIESVKKRIRNILGAQELIILREALINKAIESIRT